ncbi:SDR family NAD(P)-dependent oxidoreductase [Vogesella sp. LIG4]|uniref:SDR family NAD(P)-dependent oxidoreductase n=1 Tax=Vogesella sp. LIG4 TaxID=1192162 RepID=UPI00081F8A18|nr:SDR family NAD(P)-dependent oxidoreductase [Vogesella sp. LIG4]SCK23410.1 hypothetical protein PSELUDRAFT_2726 [Vogesella sp. LIG4]
MKAAIVTGASRGLGAALSAQLLADGYRVAAIARDCGSLPQHPQLITLDADLADSQLLPLIMERALAALGSCASYTLINNAGTVQPIASADALPDAATLQAVALNLSAPMLLCSHFLAHTPASSQRRIINISSGAAANPYPGWAVYCATKAGLDHFTRTLAVEQAAREVPALAVSLYPGVIDTGMQAEIRSADPSAFPGRPRFEALKADGELTTPEAAAARIVGYLDSPAFGSQSVLDIRQL